MVKKSEAKKAVKALKSKGKEKNKLQKNSKKKENSKKKGVKVKDKNKKVKNKSKDKKKEKSKKIKSLENKKLSKRQVIALLVSSLILLISTTIVLILIALNLNSRSIAEFLPQKNTIFFVELNLKNKQYNLAKEKVKQEISPQIVEAIFSNFIKEYINKDLDFVKDLKPYIKNKVALSLHYQNSSLIPVLSINLQNEKNFLENFKNTKVHKVVKDNFLFISPNPSILETIFQTKTNELISSTQSFSKVSSNLPSKNLAFLYSNFDLLREEDFYKFLEIEFKDLPKDIFKDLGDTLIAQGLTVNYDPTQVNFVFNNYLGVNTEHFEDKKFINFKGNYEGILTNLIDENTLFFYGAEEFEEIFSQNLALYTGVKNSRKDQIISSIDYEFMRFFGENISFSDDFLPLFEEEFALMANLNEENIVEFALVFKNSLNFENKVTDLLEEILKEGVYLGEEAIYFELEDGSISEELISKNIQIVEKELPGDFEVKAYSISTQPNEEIFLAKNDYLTVLSGSNKLSNNILKSSEYFEGGSVNWGEFKVKNQSLITNSDEITYLKLTKIIESYNKNSPIKNFVFLGDLLTGKQYNANSIMSTSYLDFIE